MKNKKWWIAAVIVALIALYAIGTFDKVLARSGLNAQECAITAFGQTLCGKELRAWCDATDPLRAGDPSAAQSQKTCDEVRNR